MAIDNSTEEYIRGLILQEFATRYEAEFSKRFRSFAQSYVGIFLATNGIAVVIGTVCFLWWLQGSFKESVQSNISMGLSKQASEDVDVAIKAELESERKSLDEVQERYKESILEYRYNSARVEELSNSSKQLLAKLSESKSELDRQLLELTERTADLESTIANFEESKDRAMRVNGELGDAITKFEEATQMAQGAITEAEKARDNIERIAKETDLIEKFAELVKAFGDDGDVGSVLKSIQEDVSKVSNRTELLEESHKLTESHLQKLAVSDESHGNLLAEQIRRLDSVQTRADSAFANSLESNNWINRFPLTWEVKDGVTHVILDGFLLVYAGVGDNGIQVFREEGSEFLRMGANSIRFFGEEGNRFITYNRDGPRK